jgi:hypothetical protein
MSSSLSSRAAVLPFPVSPAVILRDVLLEIYEAQPGYRGLFDLLLATHASTPDVRDGLGEVYDGYPQYRPWFLMLIEMHCPAAFSQVVFARTRAGIPAHSGAFRGRVAGPYKRPTIRGPRRR